MEENKRSRRKRNSNELNEVQTKHARYSQDLNDTLIEVCNYIHILTYIGSKVIVKLKKCHM
jgi:hypothetical protein